LWPVRSKFQLVGEIIERDDRARKCTFFGSCERCDSSAVLRLAIASFIIASTLLALLPTGNRQDSIAFAGRPR